MSVSYHCITNISMANNNKNSFLTHISTDQLQFGSSRWFLAARSVRVCSTSFFSGIGELQGACDMGIVQSPQREVWGRGT